MNTSASTSALLVNSPTREEEQEGYHHQTIQALVAPSDVTPSSSAPSLPQPVKIVQNYETDEVSTTTSTITESSPPKEQQETIHTIIQDESERRKARARHIRGKTKTLLAQNSSYESKLVDPLRSSSTTPRTGGGGGLGEASRRSSSGSASSLPSTTTKHSSTSSSSVASNPVQQEFFLPQYHMDNDEDFIDLLLVNEQKNNGVVEEERGSKNLNKEDTSKVPPTTTTNNNNNKKALKSIMTIRTLQQSLATTEKDNNWKKVVSTQRRRKRLNKRVNGFRKEVAAVSTTITPGSRRDEGGTTIDCQVSTEKFDVRYDHVSVREYPMTLGDNPSVTRGPPVTLDWQHDSEHHHDFEAYETFRKVQRRQKLQMKMPSNIRSEILINLGHSTTDIHIATREVFIIQKQRIKSIESIRGDKIDETIEFMRRILCKPFKSKKIKDEERALKEYYDSKKSFTNEHASKARELATKQEQRARNMDPIRSGEGARLLSRSRSDTDLARYSKDNKFVSHQEDMPEEIVLH